MTSTTPVVTQHLPSAAELEALYDEIREFLSPFVEVAMRFHEVAMRVYEQLDHWYLTDFLGSELEHWYLAVREAPEPV